MNYHQAISATAAQLTLRHATSTIRPFYRGTALDPAVAVLKEFRRAQGRCFKRAEGNRLSRGVAQRQAGLLVFDFDDTIARLYGPVALLNLKYLKEMAQREGKPFTQIARRTAALGRDNPDAVVHDPRQLVRALFGDQTLAKRETQALLQRWEQEKRQAFAAGVDKSFAEVTAHFKGGGSKIAILSNSPETPFKERLFILDQVLQRQGSSLFEAVDYMVCKPDPAQMTPRPAMTLAVEERYFHAALKQSGKFSVIERRMPKEDAIMLIKTRLEQKAGGAAPIRGIVQIGDQPSDLTSAHKAGVQSVWTTGHLLTGMEKIAMRMVGEPPRALDLADMFSKMAAPPQRHGPPQRPHAVVGRLGYLSKLFAPPGHN